MLCISCVTMCYHVLPMPLKSTGVKLDSSDLKKLKKIAIDEERSVGFLIRHAIKLYLAEKHK
jgi:Ribbon-helix-helix protein, copG family